MLKIDNKFREDLKKPFGKIYDSVDDILSLLEGYAYIISVGDITTKNLIESNIYPNIGIIDYKNKRKKIDHNFEYHTRLLNTKNPAGTVSSHLWETIDIAISSCENSDEKLLIVVDGEEDLAVLPSIILALENSVVLYGQPDEGLVLVNVDEIRSKVELLYEKIKGENE